MSWCSSDATIGPLSGSACRGGLDFTFMFELICFSYLPCTVFILGTLSLRVCSDLGNLRLAQSGILRLVKLAAFTALFASYLACIIVHCIVEEPGYWRVAVGAAATQMASSLLALYISNQYHLRSPRSSAWVSTWLAIACILELAIVRTHWLVKGNTSLAVAYTLAVSFKAVCLLLENVDKRTLLVNPTCYCPEELASPLKRAVFGWVYPLLRKGFFTVLAMDHLQPISADLKSADMKSDQSLKPLQRKHKSLFQDLVNDMPKAFYAPVIARIFLMGFSLAQPFLIYSTLNYTANPLISKNDTKGSLLIFAFVLVFVGYAISNALYWYLVDRFKFQARSRLIELIYDCTYKSSRHFDNRATPSLITTDVESAMIAFEVFHENWASLVQIGAAVGILGAYIGWACVGPIAACVGCLISIVPIVIFIQPAMAGWNAAAADRVILTTAILRQLREVRFLGLGGAAFALIQDLRQKEITKAGVFRRLLFLVIIISGCPLVTFTLYAVQGHNGSGPSYLFVVHAFTALNLMGLIVTPFTNLLQAMPVFGAGLAALQRIQQFVDAAKETEMIEQATSFTITEGNSVDLDNASFGWTNDDVYVVKNVSFGLAKGKVLAVTGPIGSGKSTLLAGLLGLTQRSTGTVSRDSRKVSFCPQNPWIFTGTVRENIICGMSFDQAWYDMSISACAMAEDLKRWQHADLHDVGNDGCNLSGGQRQRVALARAVYARNPLVLLDDPLNGLDSGSAEHVRKQLLGPNGLFRRHAISIVVVTHSLELIRDADQVLLLAKDGIVAQQGPPDAILAQESRNMHALTSLHELDFGKPNQHHANDSQPFEDVRGEGALALAREDASRKSGDRSVYWYYVKASGCVNTLVFLLGSALTAASWQIGIAWIKQWGEDVFAGRHHSIGHYIGIYGLITAVAGVGLIGAAGGSMIFMVSRGSSSFHSALLRGVARAPVSHFGAADIGITINRFIQDLRLIDWELPLAMVNTISYGLICLTQMVVIAYASRYMAFAILVAIAVLVVVQRFYLRTSRQLRLLDIEAKAPLYTNFHETIQGMPSIRAFGEGLGQLLTDKQRTAANNSQKPMFLLAIVQRLLSLIIDLVVAFLATILITLVVKAPAGSVASLGVGLVNLTLFNQFLTFVIRFWTELENSLGAISRIKNFAANTPAANGYRVDPTNLTDISLDVLTAVAGTEITFEGVTVFYQCSASSPATDGPDARVAALEHVSLRIPAGQRLGIVGRSGSGKSTMLSCIARVLSPSQGIIRFGGIDIASLDQETVQTNLVCVTQSFFFLPKLSLEDNLDLGAMIHQNRPVLAPPPQRDMSPDEDMVGVLKDVGMWNVIEERGGLLATFDPDVWSTGELQLLNLARAVLKARRMRKRTPLGHGWKILLLDEATSSVDRQTALTMQRIIREEFVGYTIITVVHRLEDLGEDLDWVVRLDKGRLVEEGSLTEYCPSQGQDSCGYGTFDLNMDN